MLNHSWELCDLHLESAERNLTTGAVDLNSVRDMVVRVISVFVWSCVVWWVDPPFKGFVNRSRAEGLIRKE
jgi:hypothetical protein